MVNMKINMKRMKRSYHKSLFLLTMMKKKTFTVPLLAMKKKRICVKSLQQQQSLSSIEPEFYLPEDCWEHVFSFIINPKDKKTRNFKSLSLVSKHFLSITNRLIFSMKIYYPQFCFLPHFFHRFPNLTSLDLWFVSYDLDASIALSLRDRPTLKSLSIFGIELKDANYITSHFIDSLVSLKGLNSLKFQFSLLSDDLFYSIASQGLPLKTFVLENCTGFSYHGIYDLLSKCHKIQHLGLEEVDFLNTHHLSQLSLLLPNLISIDLSGCLKLTKLALFALIKNCHSLGEIVMKHMYIRKGSVENSDTLKDFDVNSQLKFLDLHNNAFINDETIRLFTFIFPNLERLELGYCSGGISKKGIYQILNRCCKIRDLDLSNCNELRGLKMNFVLHHLEVLDLSETDVDDETLYEISKCCCGLLDLTLISCKNVTEKGVMSVVENCTQLEEIDLSCCARVNVDAVVSMLSPRPLSREENVIWFL